MSHDRLKRPCVSFTQVPNDLICSTELTCKAKVVYCYLISRPDDWKFYTKEIVKNMKETINTVESAIKELISFGWIEKEQIRVKGRFSHSVYSIFYEVSTVPQKTVHGKTVHDKTVNGNLTPTNTNLTNTDFNNTNPTQREEISFKSFKREFINKYKDIIFTLDNCPPFSKDTQFKLNNQGLVFNLVSNKLLHKDESYLVWNCLYNNEISKRKG